MDIKFRKLEPNDEQRRLHRGILLRTHDNNEPCYLAEVAHDDTKFVYARIERDVCLRRLGINMWGGRYRWAVATRGKTVYFDTLREAKEDIGLQLYYRLRAATGGDI